MTKRFLALLLALAAALGSLALPLLVAAPARANIIINPFTFGRTVTVSLVPARSSCTAPCVGFFDASGTTSTKTTRPFHEISYTWAFGDVGSGTWTTGALGTASRNADKGPIAGHLFETPGSKTVCVTADDFTTSATTCTTFTVDDPEVVYAGALTDCVSTTGTYTNLPAGGCTTHGSVATWAAAMAFKGDGKRLLFRRGETWTASAAQTVAFNTANGGQIGVFGAGTSKATIQRTAGYTAQDGTLVFSGSTTSGMKGWTVYDLNFDHSLISIDSHYAVWALGGIDQLLVLRVNGNATGRVALNSAPTLDIYNNDGNVAHSGHHIWDQLSIVDCTTSAIPVGTASPNTWPYGTYLAGERVFFAGNDFDLNGSAAAGTSHVTRWPYLGKGIIAHSSLKHAGQSEHEIKLHSEVIRADFTGSISGTVLTVTALTSGWGSVLNPIGVNQTLTGAGVTPFTAIVSQASGTTGGVGTYNINLSQTVASESMKTVYQVEYSGLGAGSTRWVVINDNLLEGAFGSLIVGLGTQSANVYEMVHDVIFEGNWLKYSSVPNASAEMVNAWGEDQTFRNNILDASSGNFVRAFNVTRRGTAPAVQPNRIDISHNTVYYGDTDNDFTAVWLATGVTNVTAKNNLFYAPNDSQHIGITDTDGTATTANNSTTADGALGVRTDPTFLGALSTITNFGVTGTPYPKTAGTTGTKVRKDIFGTTRSTSVPTLGAAE